MSQENKVKVHHTPYGFSMSQYPDLPVTYAFATGDPREMKLGPLGYDLANSQLRQQLADVSHERDLLRAAAAGQWRKGAPPHPWDSEWFLADVGEAYVVLRPLPEEYTYDFTTVDGTYFMRHRVKRWAQLSGSEYVQPTEVKS